MNSDEKWLKALADQGLPRIDAIEEQLAAVVLALKSMENRLERIESRLTYVERATPLKRPPKPRL